MQWLFAQNTWTCFDRKFWQRQYFDDSGDTGYCAFTHTQTHTQV